MGVVIGLTAGIGFLLIFWWLVEPEQPTRTTSSALGRRIQDVMIQAGLPQLRLGHAVALSALAGLIGLLTGWILTAALPIGIAFGALASMLPGIVISGRARKRREELRSLWPDVVDDLLSSVRAGNGLPETLLEQAERAPAVLRPAFAQYSAHYRATGKFDASLDVLKEAVADPVADRIVEALRLARSVGGADLGNLLRTVAQMLREDMRTRGELQARQSWTVNGARVAAVAPWTVLLLLSSRPEATQAFRTSEGAMVLLGGAVATVLAYFLMNRLGRLPEEERVLR